MLIAGRSENQIEITSRVQRRSPSHIFMKRKKNPKKLCVTLFAVAAVDCVVYIVHQHRHSMYVHQRQRRLYSSHVPPLDIYIAVSPILNL